MKKNKKTIQDNANSTKVIPPYPRWVKICCVLGWGLITMGFAADILSIDNFAKLFLYLSFLLVMVVCGYGVYRAVRYFPRRTFCVLALLVIVGGILFLLLPALIQKRAIDVFQNARGILFLVLGGLIVGQGILALFWKKVRKLGWFIFYTALFTTLAITGQVIDYVTRDQVGDYIIPVGVQVGPDLDCIRPDCSYVYSYEIEKLTEYKNENPTEYKKQTKKLFIR